MEELNSYGGLAENDYMYAKAGISVCGTIGNYNNVVAGCAASAEKYLKAILELSFDSEDADVMKLMHSHNLRALYNKVIEKHTLSLSSRDCKWLGDFYFDARYPGDNFIKTNKNDAIEAIDLLENIRNEVLAILAKAKATRDNDRNSLQNLKAFEPEKK